MMMELVILALSWITLFLPTTDFFTDTFSPRLTDSPMIQSGPTWKQKETMCDYSTDTDIHTHTYHFCLIQSASLLLMHTHTHIQRHTDTVTHRHSLIPFDCCEVASKVLMRDNWNRLGTYSNKQMLGKNTGQVPWEKNSVHNFLFDLSASSSPPSLCGQLTWH